MRMKIRWLAWSSLGVAAFIVVGVWFDWSKGDWASWVQAIGSIGAIFATGRYVQWQHDLETKRLALEEQLKHLRRTKVITELVYANALYVRYFAMQFANRQTVSDVVEGRSGLDPVEVDRVGSHLAGIPLHELDDQQVVRCVVLSAQHAAQTRDLARRVLRDFRGLNERSFQNAAEAMEEAASQCEAFHKTLVDLVASETKRLEMGA